MFNVNEASPVITNCTFTGNSADQGGGMYNQAYPSPDITNSIMWGDTPDEFASDGYASPNVTYSDVQGGFAGVGNIDADPLFVDPANNDFHLSAESPAIDTGSNSAPNLPTHDFEGDSRILDGNGDGAALVDMGIDEVVPWAPVVVEVVIDIRPGNEHNFVQLSSHSTLPVAILTTPEFDANTVDYTKVVFAGVGPVNWEWEDVDRDGDVDLLLYFSIQELNLDENSTEATLTGVTYDGTLIEGTDMVDTVP